MEVLIKNIDRSSFSDLFYPCKGCLYWEHPALFGKITAEEAAKLKLDWFESAAESFGPCGIILYSGGEPVAYCQFGPPGYFENIKEYESRISPTSEEAVLITCLYVRPGYRGKGNGRKLLQYLIRECKNRGIKAIETYARDDSDDNPSGPTPLYLSMGFKTIKSKKWGDLSLSLLRLDLNR
ncbi:MAG: hypothetical protein DRN21_04380 [Thermoplasmata archaeon]|nr:MAG: hypothetical protein DRN21_04380 [Thermoplasmata archaeon]